MKYIKLSKWAQLNSYTYQGAWFRFKRGDIPGAKQEPSGTILVPFADIENPKTKRAITYCRCSSQKQTADLKTQQQRVLAYCENNGFDVIKSVSEIASGMNDTRKGLNSVISRTDFDYLIIENKDRLTRFGFNYIEQYLNSKNIQIIVINAPNTEKDELVQDLVSVVTSFCARLYSKRRAKNKCLNILNEINKKEK